MRGGVLISVIIERSAEKRRKIETSRGEEANAEMTRAPIVAALIVARDLIGAG